MPIIDGGIEYTIPDEIKNKITMEFLIEFRNQLFRICGYSLSDFAENSAPANTSTSGWHAAFGVACLNTHNDWLLDYWNSLEWYDSDIFDSELTDMLVKKHLILAESTTIIAKELGVKEDDLVYCEKCGGVHLKELCSLLPDDDDFYVEDLYPQYICPHCLNIKETKNGNERATDYYKDALERIRKYNDNHSDDKQASNT